MIYLTLFITFFKIGLFGFGGGYGMLSLIQTEMVNNHGWMTAREFTDIVAISQVTPGPIGINSATYCGYTALENAGMSEGMCVLGSVVATLALMLPSLIMMLIIARMLLRFKDNNMVKSVFGGIRPVVVGLLAAAALLLMTPENFSTPTANPWQFYWSIVLFAAAFVGVKFLKVNPIRMIIYSGVAGLLLFYPSEASAQRRMPRGTFTTDTLMCHDPVMAYERGTYHLFSTGQGIQHATSRDRKTWTVHAAPTLTMIPKWAHDSVPRFRTHLWAPDIIRYRDMWWLAYSCSTFGKNTSAIGLASTRFLSERSVWNDEGAIVCSQNNRDDWNAIDPAFVIDHEGNPWLSYGSFWDGIQLVRLDSTMHIADGEKPQTIARRYANKRENPIEAPFIIYRDGWYYLFVSWDYCCRGMKSTYHVVVGRSKTVCGPYLDREGKPMAEGGGTLFIEGDKKEFEAIGHSAAYEIEGQWIFIAHGYSVELGGQSILVERPISWTSDGWPELK